jgi:Dolichyl-phosphate-mannose-protein mannosyltransferase
MSTALLPRLRKLPRLGKRTAAKPSLRVLLTPARIALALVVFGVICRVFRYSMRFPLWGDETFISYNLLTRDCLGLTRKLDLGQVAPLFFLWSEKLATLLFGTSEYALRLFPLLAGLVGLLLLWRFARITVGSLAACCTVGLFALARWPVSMSTCLKPYSYDLLFALLLILPAVYFLRAPEDSRRWRWLCRLALLVPFALLFSYPAVFVAGGISVALVGALWRTGTKRETLWFIVYNALMLATFAGNYLIIGREQLDPQTNSVGTFMETYWAHGFPPMGWRLPLWLLEIHTGRMMAYPIGDGNFGSMATFLLFVVGIWALRRQTALLALCLVPFALNLIAAALHKYPYGGCCRLSQHLAPAVCLLAGTGLAWVCRRVAGSPRGAIGGVAICSLAFALFGLGELLTDAIYPYRDTETAWMARVSEMILKAARPEDQIVVAKAMDDSEPMYRYHLGRHARVRWGGDVDLDRLHGENGQLWWVELYIDDDGIQPIETPVRPQGLDGWVVADEIHYVMPPMKHDCPFRTACITRWAPPGAPARAPLTAKP